MPRELHTAFDAGWKAWAREQVAAGRTQVTVQEFLQVLNRAAEAVPGLRGRTSDTMSWLFHIEAYKTLGLKPTDVFVSYCVIALCINAKAQEVSHECHKTAVISCCAVSGLAAPSCC